MVNTLWDPNIGNVTNPSFTNFTAGTFNLGAGGVVDSTSGVAGRTDYIQMLMLPVTAVANTDFTMSVPVGCTLLSATVYTSVAYTAATDCKIQIGNVAAGAQYVAPVSIAAIGMVPLTLLAAQTPAFLSMPAGFPNLFIRIVQSGAASAVGTAKLVINYST
jgi:hypothetical protein